MRHLLRWPHLPFRPEEDQVTQEIRNLILAALLSILVLIGWSLVSERFFPEANLQPALAPQTTPAAPPATKAATAPAASATAPVAAGSVPATTPGVIRDRAVVLAESPRVAIDTPRLQGSINLKGGRFDDLVMTDYRVTIDKKSPAVRLFSPSGTADAYFGQFGWSGAGAPPADAMWTASATRLTPESPVTLSWTSPTGAVFQQVISIDKNFMFSVQQRVTNPGPAAITVQPWGLVSRLGTGPEKGEYALHIGPIGVLDGTLKDSNIEYADLTEDGPQSFTSTGGWLGITDKYWLAALVPDQKTKIDARFAAAPGNLFQTDYLSPAITIPAGQSASSQTRLFAGAKEITLLDTTMKSLDIPNFDLAVSWGWFKIIAQPIFWLLDFLFRLTGNFGVAIIGLTLVVRALMFPIANKQYESMAKMRVVAPKMKAIQEKYKDDKVRAQQEMMALYKTEKVNPLAGCLPILIQIPIFYALYKALLVSIEMRHQPFALWIKDLSAPDPLTPLNLFGLIPWDPPGFLHIGVFPIILGVTMWLQQRMNPTPMDPVQKQVFAIMPWMFMFIMAPFAAGLQLYWIVNNLISIAQQWYMLRKYPMPATPPAAETVTVKAKAVTKGPK
jgi:YidC/Oxa1 family membrane protein insertase